MSEPPTRLGVDIGGTFTDVVVQIGDARETVKVLTTPSRPEDAIIQGIEFVCERAGVEPGAVSSVIHGTTLATNALIERRGAHTALITTRGFRDVIEMRTESRFEQYDLDLQLPTPLIARKHRLVLDERIGAQGNVLRPLQDDDLAAVVQQVADGGFESVAVGLIHSYMNDAHEREVARELARQLPDVMVSLSSEVSPQMREYERFNTVVANAYVKPLMKSYLSRLLARLTGIGMACPVFLMHSGGGIISLASAQEFPVRLVESGPAGGAIFAAQLAARHGVERALSFDMGGTTAKICLVRGHTPATSRVFEVARSYRFKKGSGMPISIPVIDMVEIGAGGGSIASVDALRQIRVGPGSAGSEPGPACYQRGGEDPTVTDADLLLGRLDPDNFAGGSIQLSAQLAEQALTDRVASSLAMDIDTAAYGVSEVVDENMANAARVHAVENGEDLASYSMIAFGGAAPLHAARLCQKLGIRRLLVPPGAGVGSAIGFLQAPFSFEATRSVYMRLSEFRSEAVGRLLDELREEAVDFVRTCDADSPIDCEFKVYMRYVGQGWEIPVDLDDQLILAPDAAAVQSAFELAYHGLFGRVVAGLDIEITSWSAHAATPRLVPPALNEPDVNDIDASRLPRRKVFEPALREHVDALCVERESLAAGSSLAGPVVITESETSVIVPERARVTVCQDATLRIDFPELQQ